jgi:isoquinoline 1-oxidoreductase subunit beta
MTDVTHPSRREFIKTGAVAAGGLIIAFSVPGTRRMLLAEPARGAGTAPELFAPNAFLRIGTDDTVTVLLAHSEMGQGIWTALPMLIAEELDADWSRIRVEHAPAAPVYKHTVYGMQMTGGSSSTWSEFERYREAGATARALLVAAAAQRFGVSAADCRTENGVVTAGGKRARYGELAEAAAKLAAPKKVELKDPKSWRIIGKPTKRLDTPEKITGRAGFGIDVRFDGLKTATVARAPAFGMTLTSFDDSAAKAVPGVRAVVRVPSGVAVVADHFWAAKLGRDALKVEWAPGESAGLSTEAMRRTLAEAANSAGKPAAQAGNTAAAMARAVKKIEAEYHVPYLAHAPMEPQNCTVRLSADQCEIWAGTQFQTNDQMLAAKITGLKPEQVEVHTTFLGGGFGRRANPTSDFVTEAVHVAKASGMPVKVVWTREDDIHGGYYRPSYTHKARIGFGADGKPVAWEHTIAGQSIIQGTPFEPMMMKNGIDPTSVEGVADSPYMKAIPAHRVGLATVKTPISVLWWRSVGHTHNAFVMESLIDEAATLAGVDPVEYRKSLLAESPRHRGVLELAVAKAGWGQPLPAGRARGVAVHESFGSFVAQVAEVSMERGQIRVHRVTCAIDCGVVVNPAGVVAQMESGIAFGLSAALHSALTFKDGQVEQTNFHDYQVLRLSEMPVVEVHIVPSTEKSGGVGEPGTPPIAPAVANAVFALTKQRLRELPLRPATA